MHRPILFIAKPVHSTCPCCHASDESQPRKRVEKIVIMHHEEWERILIKNATNSCLNMRNNPHTPSVQPHSRWSAKTYFSAFVYGRRVCVYVIDEQTECVVSLLLLAFNLIVGNIAYQINTQRGREREQGGEVLHTKEHQVNDPKKKLLIEQIHTQNKVYILCMTTTTMVMMTMHSIAFPIPFLCACRAVQYRPMSECGVCVCERDSMSSFLSYSFFLWCFIWLLSELCRL